MENNGLVLPLAVGVLVALSIFAFWVALRRRPVAEEELLERLASPLERQQTPEVLEAQISFRDRVLKPFLRGLLRKAGRWMPQRNLEGLQQRLDTAGRPYGMTVTDFLGLQLVTGLAAGGLALAWLRFSGHPWPQALTLALAAALGGGLMPLLWLRRRTKRRQEEILRALPDTLDMLTIAVAAGLGFDGALQKVSEKWDNALSREFAQIVREMQVGVPRIQALRDAARRIQVREFSNFIAVIVQADQLGLSIADVLQIQSKQMRVLRRQRAEELAHQAPIKMLFPLIFLIFPAMFAVILGPAVPTLLNLFKGM